MMYTNILCTDSAESNYDISEIRKAAQECQLPTPGAPRSLKKMVFELSPTT